MSDQEVFVDVVVSFQFTIEPDAEVNAAEFKGYYADEANRVHIRRAAEDALRIPRRDQVGWFNENVMASITEVSGEEVLSIKEVEA